MTRYVSVLATCVLVWGAGCELLEGNRGGDGTIPEGGGVGDACTQDAHCRQGLACIDERCATTGNTSIGSPCILSDECADDLQCGMFGVCEPAGDLGIDAPCTATAECERGLTCALVGLEATCQPQGDGDLGATCAAHTDCRAGLYCVGGACRTFADGLESLGGETCPPTGETEGEFRVHFEVPRGGEALSDFYRLPYPNDIRTIDGRPDLRDHATPGDGFIGVDVVRMYLDRITEELQGFGTNEAVIFRFSGPIDFQSLELSGDSPGLEAVDLESGQRQILHYMWAPSQERFVCQNSLRVRPVLGRTWTPGRTHAVLVRRSVRNSDGEPIGRDADFAAVIGDAVPADTDLAAAHAAYAPLRDWIADAGIDPDEIAAAAVFTTQDPLRPMDRMREAVRRDGVQVQSTTACDDGVVSPCAGDDPDRACGTHADFREIHLEISLPVYQRGTPPYLADGGDIAVDSGGVPELVRHETVCAAVTLPTGAAMPGGGWPVVVYAHGTGGSFRSHVTDGTAASLTGATDPEGTAVPFAVIGFDQIQHANRRGESDEIPDVLVFNFLNPHAARDNWLQGAADAMALAELVLGWTPDGDLAFDPAHLYFFGHSQGGISGPLALAYDDAYPVAVLSGAGGLLVESLIGKRNPVDIASAMQVALAEQGRLNVFHPVLNRFQAWFERSDAVNYGRLVARQPPADIEPKHVFQTYGLLETYTPVRTMQALGISLGVQLANQPPLESFEVQTVAMPVRANLPGQRTVVMQQYAPDGYDGHFVVFRDEVANRRVASFLASAVTDADGIPTLAE